ncbi:hypothetical protein FZ103_15885 [Streptomonospora sp. PA3]|nr:hypothetical protein [Streptomonospora sp. PA3]
MAEQVRHLIELAKLQCLTLQVLPFGSGAHPALTLASFSILRVEHRGLVTVYLQESSSHSFLTNAENVDHYSSIHRELRTAATEPGDRTVQLLERIAADHRSEA